MQLRQSSTQIQKIRQQCRKNKDARTQDEYCIHQCEREGEEAEARMGGQGKGGGAGGGEAYTAKASVWPEVSKPARNMVPISGMTISSLSSSPVLGSLNRSSCPAIVLPRESGSTRRSFCNTPRMMVCTFCNLCWPSRADCRTLRSVEILQVIKSLCSRQWSHNCTLPVTQTKSFVA